MAGALAVGMPSQGRPRSGTALKISCSRGLSSCWFSFQRFQNNRSACWIEDGEGGGGPGGNHLHWAGQAKMALGSRR